MKGRLISAAALVLGLLIASGCSQPPAAPKTAQPAAAADARLAGSYRFDRNGWIFVHLEGPPATLGYQHGYLLAAETADLLRVFRAFTEHQTKKDWAFFRTAGEQILWPKMDAEYQQEIDGIVAGLNAKQVAADRWDIVALNAIEELPDYYVPWLEKQQGKKPTQKAPGNCSAFVATGSYTKDGKIVIGHNNVDQLRHRLALEHRLRLEAREGLPHPDGWPAGRHRQRRRLRHQLERDHGDRDDDHRVRTVRPERRARVHARAQGAAVRRVDRRLRADHAGRQQRGLRQRLARRRQQDRRDRAVRARPEGAHGRADEGRLLRRVELPGRREADPATRRRSTRRRRTARPTRGGRGGSS